MGVEKDPLAVKFFIAVTYCKHRSFESIRDLLCTEYGEPDRLYGPVPFSWSDYYSDEMGEDLLKYYAVYPFPFKREQLPEIKNFTNELEKKWALEGKRTINLDPGYLARDKLVLASTKDFFHRLYLGRGIYGEVTLHYRRGVFRHFSWSYPDYKESEFQDFLSMARADLVYKLRKEA
ncbi:hypothetical protein CHISP_2596 [Chitinispirillum alkaliphilum]|nr:hypothetical protein CHISP_2596 [Chitinispirillum alkaliphilum]